MNATDPLVTRLGVLQRRMLVLGMVGLAVWAVLAFTGVVPAISRRVAMGAYLIGYLYTLGIGLGGLVMVMIYHLTTGNWGAAIRRVTEAASRTIPLMALLFIPIVVGIPALYEWSHAETVAADELLHHKQAYLNPSAFVVRAVFYFVVWSLLTLLLNSWAARQEKSPESVPASRLSMLSGPGIVLYGLMMTFAAVDWAMSLEPHWFSTIYGVLFIVGQGASGLAFAVLVTMLLGRSQPALIPPKQVLADLGSLLFAFVMLWAYISLSQLLIVWSGNLPEEIPWYLTRLKGGWGLVGLTLAVFHFAVPFGLLLIGRLKRDPRMLVRLAALILVVRALDLGWIIAPSFCAHEHECDGVWVMLLAPLAIVGIGGVWLALFFGQLRSRSLLPYPAANAETSHAHTEAAA